MANGDAKQEDGKLNLLLRYDVVVVDEAHERTLNTDFICGALKRIQRIRRQLVEEQDRAGSDGTEVNGVNGATMSKGKGRYPVTPLKVVIMSATLDPAKFSNFFET